MEFKFYTDVLPMHEIPTFEDLDIISMSGDDAVKKFIEFTTDESVTCYQYKEAEGGEKYRHVVGYSIDLLIPHSIKREEYAKVSQSFMNQFLETYKKVPWVALAITRGEGTYIKIHVLIEKKFRVVKQQFITYKTDGYKHIDSKRLVAFRKDKYFQKRTVGGITSEVEIPADEVVLAYKAGGIKSIRETSWSKRVRMFEMSRTDFSMKFLPFIKHCLLKALCEIKSIREVTYFKYLKHKSYGTGKQTIFYNKNTRCFNVFIYEMNIDLMFWDQAIYSDTDYYQDADLVKDWTTLRQRYISRIKNKKFSYSIVNREFSMSINPFIRTDVFRENIETLRDMFESNLSNFIKTHISIKI